MTDYVELSLFEVEPITPAPHVCLAVGRCSCGRFTHAPEGPMLHQGDPRTSRKAAQRAADPARLSETQKRVLRNLYEARIHGTDGGLADCEHPGILATTAGKRRLECQRAGLVEDSGYETKNAHGSDVIVWKINAAGVAAYEASQS